MPLRAVPYIYRFVLPKSIRYDGPDPQAIYLTFDDGPTPELTPWILATLRAYGAKATFFLVGENAQRHPNLVKAILADGHSVGNHTHRHLDGWRTSSGAYMADITQAEEYIPSKLFRPPYGKITRKKAMMLHQMGFSIILWNLITYDWKPNFDLQKILNNLSGGKLIVLHDNVKAGVNLKAALPRILEWSRTQGVPCLPIAAPAT